MGIPSPTIPSFVDGTVVHQADLNALAQNLTNLYTYNQGGFNTQRPCVVAVQTVSQVLPQGGSALINFQSAQINVGNMWVASQSNQITIQVAGMYCVYGSVTFPAIATAGFNLIGRADLLLNGTTPGANSVQTTDLVQTSGGIGVSPVAIYLSNVAAGSTFFLAGAQTLAGTQSTRVSHGSSFLAAFYIGSST